GDLLAWPRALEHFRQAYTLARGSGSLHWLHNTAGYLADALAMNGNHNEAEEILSSVAADLPMQALGQRRIWVSRARLALARSDPSSALDIVGRLVASARNLISIGDIPLLALLRGKALATLAPHEESDEALHAALQGARERGMHPLCWRIHL